MFLSTFCFLSLCLGPWNDLRINNRAIPVEIEIQKRAMLVQSDVLWISNKLKTSLLFAGLSLCVLRLQHMKAHCSTHCSTLQYTSAHYSTLQHIAAHYSTLKHTTVHWSTLQHFAAHGNTLQNTDEFVNVLGLSVLVKMVCYVCSVFVCLIVCF